MQVIPLARNPREKKKKIKKEKKKKKPEKNTKRKEKHVTVLQFVPNHRYAIHVWKIVPRNHAVVCGSCRFHMFMVHVERSGTVLPFFCRGFYSITATQFMFGMWWPPMFTYLYHLLCVLLLSFMVYFMSWCLFIFIYFHLLSFIFIYFHFFLFIFISSYFFSFLLISFHFFSFLFIFFHFLLFSLLKKLLPI